ncbi:hypothetical protein CEXT_503261 [Caerostris extrusa]|uniref:Uncharacterized protein n=1 Tax=Caerostris extrusa TaxID=172846 RepID=A0AAV4P208_CAEEX|nr:hypothetical protein CEXT_503261 [Caerostris extrusa]
MFPKQNPNKTLQQKRGFLLRKRKALEEGGKGSAIVIQDKGHFPRKQSFRWKPGADSGEVGGEFLPFQTLEMLSENEFLGGLSRLGEKGAGNEYHLGEEKRRVNTGANTQTWLPIQRRGRALEEGGKGSANVIQDKRTLSPETILSLKTWSGFRRGGGEGVEFLPFQTMEMLSENEFLGGLSRLEEKGAGNEYHLCEVRGGLCSATTCGRQEGCLLLSIVLKLLRLK